MSPESVPQSRLMRSRPQPTCYACSGAGDLLYTDQPNRVFSAAARCSVGPCAVQYSMANRQKTIPNMPPAVLFEACSRLAVHVGRGCHIDCKPAIATGPDAGSPGFHAHRMCS